MKDILSALTSAEESPILIAVLALILTFIFIKELYVAIKWIKDRFDGYHNIINNKEDKEEEIEKRIDTLEVHDHWQYNKLNELGEELKKVISMLAHVQETQGKTIIDTYRNTIFNIYHDSMKQGYITQTELDRFIGLVDQYRKAGGDGVVDEKVYPEVLKLEIRQN